MFRITKTGEKNRLDVEMSGKLDAEKMKIALTELIDKSKNINNGKMLYDVVDFHIPILVSIGIAQLPSMFG